MPAWDRFFPTGGGLVSIFRSLAKSEGLGDRNVSNKLGQISDSPPAPVVWQLVALDHEFSQPSPLDILDLIALDSILTVTYTCQAVNHVQIIT